MANLPNTDRGESGPTNEFHECPTLSEWHRDADVSKITLREIRVWVVDLDAGLSTDKTETAEPRPELRLLAPDEQERAAARALRHFQHCRAGLRQQHIGRDLAYAVLVERAKNELRKLFGRAPA